MKRALKYSMLTMPAIVIGLAWFEYGLLPLLVTLGTLLLVGLLTAAFIIGSYWTRQTMQAGARLALGGEALNRYGEGQRTRAMAGLLEQIIKLSPPAPALLSGGSLELNFPIDGLDEAAGKLLLPEGEKEDE